MIYEGNRRIWLLVALFIALLLIAVAITALVISIKEDSLSCELNEFIPEPRDLYNLKNLTSVDKRAILNIYGYIQFLFDDANPKPKNVFLPLEDFSQIKLISEYPSGNFKLLLSLGDCLKMELSIWKEYASHYYQVNGIRIDYTYAGANPDTDSRNIECSVGITDMFTYDKDAHYACRHLREYQCEVRGQLKAILALEGFEFELDTDRRLAERGQFTRKAELCASS